MQACRPGSDKAKEVNWVAIELGSNIATADRVGGSFTQALSSSVLFDELCQL